MIDLIISLKHAGKLVGRVTWELVINMGMYLGS